MAFHVPFATPVFYAPVMAPYGAAENGVAPWAPTAVPIPWWPHVSPAAAFFTYMCMQQQQQQHHHQQQPVEDASAPRMCESSMSSDASTGAPIGRDEDDATPTRRNSDVPSPLARRPSFESVCGTRACRAERSPDADADEIESPVPWTRSGDTNVEMPASGSAGSAPSDCNVPCCSPVATQRTVQPSRPPVSHLQLQLQQQQDDSVEGGAESEGESVPLACSPRAPALAPLGQQQQDQVQPAVQPTPNVYDGGAQEPLVEAFLLRAALRNRYLRRKQLLVGGLTAPKDPLRRTPRHAKLCVRARGHRCNRSGNDPMQLELAHMDHFAGPCCMDCSELHQPQQQVQEQEVTAIPAAGQPLAGGVEPSAPVPTAAAAAGGSSAHGPAPGRGGGGSGAAAMRQPPGVCGVMLLGSGEEGEFRCLQELFDEWACTAAGEI